MKPRLLLLLLAASSCFLAFDTDSSGGDGSIPANAQYASTTVAPPSVFRTTKMHQIEDTTCAIETVEEANTKQLSLILSELSETLFFRLFKVDMNAKCQYDFEKKKWLDEDFLQQSDDNFDVDFNIESDDKTSSEASAHSSAGDDDLDDLDDDEDDERAGSPSSNKAKREQVKQAKVAATEVEAPAAAEEQFECTGPIQLPHPGGATGVSQLMQKPGNLMSMENNKPKTACSVDTEDDAAAQLMKNTSDLNRAKTDQESQFSQVIAAENCAEDAPEFWLDMCAKVGTEAPEFVNLMKNPETNTGYNGRHIWEAMYSENCFSHENRPSAMLVHQQEEPILPRLDVFSPSSARKNDDDGRCFEERVLYRLLSGVHSATSISIFYKYFPPTGDNPDDWGKNPRKFMKVFARHPDRLKNLYFAFVVLLRSIKKGSNFFRQYKYNTGDAVEDEKIADLIKRLLDSERLQFCHSAFEGFDERSMFLSKEVSRREFKRGFQRISALMSCVKCSRCKLHGKLNILGIGAALKVLLLPDDMLPTSMSREEIVALVNTLHAFSEALQRANELLSLYQWTHPSRKPVDVFDETNTMNRDEAASSNDDADDDLMSMEDTTVPESDTSEEESIDQNLAVAVRALQKVFQQQAATAGGSGVDAEMNKTTVVLREALLKSIESDLSRHRATSETDTRELVLNADAVVVGSGLAGMSASLTALQGGARVVLLDKEPRFGGNSGKASSGINGEIWNEALRAELQNTVNAMNQTEQSWVDGGLCPRESPLNSCNPALQKFFDDTMKSGGGRAVPSRVRALVEGSDEGLRWLQAQGVDLGLKAVLGGHSSPRTYRPATGNFIGTEVILVLEKRLREFEKTGQLTILPSTTVKGLLTQSGTSSMEHHEGKNHYTVTGVHGIRTVAAGPPSTTSAASKTPPSTASHQAIKVLAKNVVLATGGFGHDHSQKGSLLYTSRPDLRKTPTTLGKWTTGDGIKMVLALPGTRLVDMQFVQVHPTGFVDPSQPDAATKTLAAEVLRGVGGILLTESGERFCDELGTRQYVVDRMMEKQGDKEKGVRPFYLLLGKDAIKAADRHVQHYSRKNLLTEVDLNVKTNDDENHSYPIAKFRKAIKQYRKQAGDGTSKDAKDAFGKTKFINVPDVTDKVVVGKVVPVVHYTMGGVEVDDLHRVVSRNSRSTEAAAADASQHSGRAQVSTSSSSSAASPSAASSLVTRAVGDDLGDESAEKDENYSGSGTRHPIPGLFAVGEIAGGLHGKNRLGGNSLLECLVFGRVVGRQIIPKASNVERNTITTSELMKTPAPETTSQLLAQLEEAIGVKDTDSAGRTSTRSATSTVGGNKRNRRKLKEKRVISAKELAEHGSVSDCWVRLYDDVYDLTKYAKIHPGGEESIVELCGTDGTQAFESVHSRSMLAEGGFKSLGKAVDGGKEDANKQNATSINHEDKNRGPSSPSLPPTRSTASRSRKNYHAIRDEL
ncbi:unnamed protein product [Amoebophrya sp. A120]|nr:unnamed protein product [Amoebophrya sp. A120]|eukprot:GSA120T00003011001.1